MSGFIDILIMTPLWVWPVLAYVLFVGLSSVKDRERRARTLLVPVVLFSALALYKLFSAAFALPVVAGTAFGFALATAFVALSRPARGTYLTAGRKLHLEGGWMTLVVILFTFTLNYALGVVGAMAPDIAQLMWVKALVALGNGFSTGFFTMRTAAHLRAAYGRARPLALLGASGVAN